jgi:hypothetical protein
LNTGTVGGWGVSKLTRAEQYWVAFIDVWGFTAELESGNDTGTLKLLKQARQVLIESRGAITAFYMFSDCIVLINKVECYSSWNSLVKVLQSLQATAIRHEVLYRGAIFKGTMTFEDNICFGRPLIDAHRIEQRLSIPLIVTLGSHDDMEIRHFQNICQVPLKDGVVNGSFLTTDRFNLEKLIQKKKTFYLNNGPAKIAAVWSDLALFLKHNVVDVKNA